MKDGRTLPVIQPTAAGVSRRAAIQSLAAGLGASVTVPGLAHAEDHPVHRHLPHIAGQTAAAEASAPSTLDAHQFAALTALAGLIVPGAEASGTPAFIDKLLGVETADTRRRFVTALGAFDGAARAAHRAPFTGLSREQQVALLEQASAGTPSRAPAYWKKGDPIPVPQTPPGPATLRDHFDHLKGWIAGIHFSSEPGLRELGYTGNMFHQAFPGCTHDGKHA